MSGYSFIETDKVYSSVHICHSKKGGWPQKWHPNEKNVLAKWDEMLENNELVVFIYLPCTKHALRHRWYFFVFALYVSIFAPYRTPTQSNKTKVGDGYWNLNELNWSEDNTRQDKTSPTNTKLIRSPEHLDAVIVNIFKHFSLQVQKCVCAVVDRNTSMCVCSFHGKWTAIKL